MQDNTTYRYVLVLPFRPLFQQDRPEQEVFSTTPNVIKLCPAIAETVVDGQTKHIQRVVVAITRNLYSEDVWFESEQGHRPS